MIEGVIDSVVPVFTSFLLFLVVHWLGVVRERNRKPKTPYKPPPSLHCGCGHELAYHNALGTCHNMVSQRKTNTLYEYVPCRCKQYTGDLPEDWFSRDSLRQLGITMPALPSAENS